MGLYRKTVWTEIKTPETKFCNSSLIIYLHYNINHSSSNTPLQDFAVFLIIANERFAESSVILGRKVLACLGECSSNEQICRSNEQQAHITFNESF